ncbi:hypothetical protein [Enhygromyxa salina]|uniref:Uncharacterized protein n=1 Tax=Enhygromyxa salina TaxID=215803 RepID=A0A2S9YTN7_9BACT|nr:hypothetical protein [Enhygromyxa salina]PRQ08471.1 hypothetical protein ENSA7_17560 [Enhygromyxa salina]
MEIGPFLHVGLVILTILVVALAGSTRRLGFGLTLLLSIVLTPIGGFIVTMLSGARQRKPKRKPKPKRRWSWFRRAPAAEANQTQREPITNQAAAPPNQTTGLEVG